MTHRRRQLRVAPLLWLVTLLSVLQWTAPTVDPWQFARLTAGAPHEAGLAVAERLSPAIETSATSTIATEKRSPGGRSLPSADDGTATVERNPASRDSGKSAVVASSVVQGRGDPPRDRFTARSPPRAG